MDYYWQINDERIWSSAKAMWVDESEVPPADEDGNGGIIPLYSNGQPAGVDYLRETIVFYGCDLGELKNRLEKITDIQNRSAPQLTLLQEAKTGAEMRDDEEDVADIKVEYNDLLQQMQQEIRAVPPDPVA